METRKGESCPLRREPRGKKEKIIVPTVDIIVWRSSGAEDIVSFESESVLLLPF